MLKSTFLYAKREIPMVQNTHRQFFALILFCVFLLMGCGAKGPQTVIAAPVSTAGEMVRYRLNSEGTYRLDIVSPDGDGHGSGVVISSEGHILTVNHVVSHSGHLSIMIVEGAGAPKTYPVRVIGTDPLHDLAVVKVGRRFANPAILEDVRNVHPGDEVYNIGYPFNYGEMVARGRIMRLHYSRPEDESDRKLPESRRTHVSDMILSDLLAGPGSSGSSVYLASSGKLIGVMRLLILQGGPTFGMMTRAIVPVNQVEAFLRLYRIPYVMSDGTVATYPSLPPAAPANPSPSQPRK